VRPPQPERTRPGTPDPGTPDVGATARRRRATGVPAACRCPGGLAGNPLWADGQPAVCGLHQAAPGRCKAARRAKIAVRAVTEQQPGMPLARLPWRMRQAHPCPTTRGAVSLGTAGR